MKIDEAVIVGAKLREELRLPSAHEVGPVHDVRLGAKEIRAAEQGVARDLPAWHDGCRNGNDAIEVDVRVVQPVAADDSHRLMTTYVVDHLRETIRIQPVVRQDELAKDAVARDQRQRSIEVRDNVLERVPMMDTDSWIALGIGAR